MLINNQTEDVAEKIIAHYLNLSLGQAQCKDVALTYGEILSSSILKLIKFVDWDRNDVFYDLGSGVAKLALQIMFSTPINVVQGIEIRQDLYEIAIQYTKTFIDRFANGDVKNRKLILRCENFLDADIHDATIILLGSPCFTMQTMTLIGKKINNLKNIRYILTLKPIINLTQLSFWKAIRIHCSWDSALCYIYK